MATKKALVRQALTELGVDAPFGDAKRWFQKNHKLNLADATFYHVRKLMQQEKQTLVKLEKVRATLGVVDAVKAARELVDKIGKKEALALIELL